MRGLNQLSEILMRKFRYAPSDFRKFLYRVDRGKYFCDHEFRIVR